MGSLLKLSAPLWASRPDLTRLDRRISMRDGKIIQQIADQPTSQASIGFREDGKGAWLHGLSFLITYRFDESLGRRLIWPAKTISMEAV